ncbi:MAG: NF038122 family metalloprotease [Gammaproteobacteria bacterium]|jgi:hypothetical protein
MQNRKSVRNGPKAGLFVTIALCAFPLHSSALNFNFFAPDQFGLPDPSRDLSQAGFSDTALDALGRAAAAWSNRISDDIDVNIVTEFKSLSDANVIGTAGSVTLVSDPMFSDVLIDQLKADSLTEADDGIVQFLPTIDNLDITLPAGFGFAGHLSGTKANFKALGFTGLDATFGLTDARIDFNLGFNFDFDNSDGVASGFMDFETVAAHELGHALGFVSVVDDIDADLPVGSEVTITIAPTLLDLFRFGPGDNPLEPEDFTAASRNLVPGAPTYFDDTDIEYYFSTGVTEGDGRQASHWKDTDSIGILDPTLAFGQVFSVSAADLRALDVIGYDIDPVPIPPALLLFASALVLLAARSQRQTSR